jgi:hypothetical protein
MQVYRDINAVPYIMINKCIKRNGKLVERPGRKATGLNDGDVNPPHRMTTGLPHGFETPKVTPPEGVFNYPDHHSCTMQFGRIKS